MAAVARYPDRNIALRRGAHVIGRRDGEPEPPPDTNLRSWSAHLTGGGKMQFLGFVEAVSEATAIEAAVALFALRRRLAVNLRRRAPHEGRALVVRYTNQ